MDDIVVWIIIMAFYAPLHFLLPVLFLFVTGKESDAIRRQMIRKCLLDAAWSMAFAFVIVIALATQGFLSVAMLVLLVSMTMPFIRIWRTRGQRRG